MESRKIYSSTGNNSDNLNQDALGQNKNNLLISSVLIICLYLIPNLLFLWKYFDQYLTPIWIPAIIYTIVSIIIVFAPTKTTCLKLPAKYQTVLFFVAVGLLALAFTFLVKRFNPVNIGNGRYPALFAFINDVAQGIFPYSTKNFVSGFPFLFVLALPFYFLGDLGLWQIFSFIVFAVIVYLYGYHHYRDKLKVMVLLSISPMFLYEIVARSELFSNMVSVILYYLLFKAIFRRQNIFIIILLGVVGGFLLSTRGIVLLAYIIFMGYLYRQGRFNYIALIIALGVGFAITIIPFMLWNLPQFIELGPFAIQMLYIPKWFLFLLVLLAAYFAFKVKSEKQMNFAIAITMFVAVLYPFLVAVLNFGLAATLFSDKFDISYFNFAQPFFLLALNWPVKEKALYEPAG